ncbi:hypothetical protein M405DRAFT_886440 [Rhizopogon salebrosus TDB-379]|nr:hypothetical protein M405DRAFT_886457 [Rhizopogon salebrosus TDB-379]KAJ8579559.1 hypothetical protein M405DRAFT_886440 [Rhizopogon salebrosus TDB-379]
MSPWVLPGRKSNPVRQYKSILQKSFAYSRTFNPRNIEFYWYPVWDQTLSDLVSDVANLVVAPQFPVWFVPQDDQDSEDEVNEDDDGDGDDPEEVETHNPNTKNSAPAAGNSTFSGDDDAGEFEAGNISFASTVPQNNARSAIADFAIIHVTGQRQPKLKNRYGGWRITGAKVGLLVEVKRFARRSLTGKEFNEELELEVAPACDDLLEQAAHLFLQPENKDQDAVLAIAAAGPFWCNTKIYRANVKSLMRRLSQKDPTYNLEEDLAEWDRDPQVQWSNMLRLDIVRSNDRLHTIYKSLKGMGVLEVPADG